ncbi:MAG: phage tail sheath C-terminal domain-containing protein, partial [Pseudomonadota bacterium]
TPDSIRDTVIHAYTQLAQQGVVENVAAFSQALVVERNQLDANRVDIALKTDMVNQLRVLAVAMETNLELES